MNENLKRQFEEAIAVDAVVSQQKRNSAREIGVVQAYDKGKGFGFIIDDEREKLFVHQSQIVSPGFRHLAEGQKVSFRRGENRGKPWAEDVRNPNGTPIVNEKEEEAPTAQKKRRQQLKEQWKNFFDIPQYALKCYGESYPGVVSNPDTFILGEPVPQLGKMFALLHGCCQLGSAGNDCSRWLREKLTKFIAKAYEDTDDVPKALASAFEAAEREYTERAAMKSLTDGAEVTVALFAHALNKSGQPCVQLHMAQCGACIVLACTADGNAVRLCDRHAIGKDRSKLEEAGFEVSEDGLVQVSFAEAGKHRPSDKFKLPATRLLGGRPFKTNKGKVAVQARPDVKKVREWRCVAGEELFVVVCSQEILSVMNEQEVINAALDAWGSNAEGLAGAEAASKAVVRTALAQGADFASMAALVIQLWWQEKPLQRLLARRLDRMRAGAVGQAASSAAPADDVDDMFA